jgi:putative acetyltransferase
LRDGYRIEAYRDDLREQLVEVWERSVLASHHFLDPDDFEEIKKEVQE